MKNYLFKTSTFLFAGMFIGAAVLGQLSSKGNKIVADTKDAKALLSVLMGL